MVIPAAMQIEVAADSLKANSQRNLFALEDQRKELETFGESRAQTLGASGISDDFKIGYALGLQTARVMIATNPHVLAAEWPASDVL